MPQPVAPGSVHLPRPKSRLAPRGGGPETAINLGYSGSPSPSRARQHSRSPERGGGGGDAPGDALLEVVKQEFRELKDVLGAAAPKAATPGAGSPPQQTPHGAQVLFQRISELEFDNARLRAAVLVPPSPPTAGGGANKRVQCAITPAKTLLPRHTPAPARADHTPPAYQYPSPSRCLDLGVDPNAGESPVSAAGRKSRSPACDAPLRESPLPHGASIDEVFADGAARGAPEPAVWQAHAEDQNDSASVARSEASRGTSATSPGPLGDGAALKAVHVWRDVFDLLSEVGGETRSKAVAQISALAASAATDAAASPRGSDTASSQVTEEASLLAGAAIESEPPAALPDNLLQLRGAILSQLALRRDGMQQAAALPVPSPFVDGAAVDDSDFPLAHPCSRAEAEGAGGSALGSPPPPPPVEDAAARSDDEDVEAPSDDEDFEAPSEEEVAAVGQPDGKLCSVAAVEPEVAPDRPLPASPDDAAGTSELVDAPGARPPPRIVGGAGPAVPPAWQALRGRIMGPGSTAYCGLPSGVPPAHERGDLPTTTTAATAPASSPTAAAGVAAAPPSLQDGLRRLRMSVGGYGVSDTADPSPRGVPPRRISPMRPPRRERSPGVVAPCVRMAAAPAVAAAWDSGSDVAEAEEYVQSPQPPRGGGPAAASLAEAAPVDYRKTDEHARSAETGMTLYRAASVAAEEVADISALDGMPQADLSGPALADTTLAPDSVLLVGSPHATPDILRRGAGTGDDSALDHSVLSVRTAERSCAPRTDHCEDSPVEACRLPKTSRSPNVRQAASSSRPAPQEQSLPSDEAPSACALLQNIRSDAGVARAVTEDADEEAGDACATSTLENVLARLFGAGGVGGVQRFPPAEGGHAEGGHAEGGHAEGGHAEGGHAPEPFPQLPPPPAEDGTEPASPLRDAAPSPAAADVSAAASPAPSPDRPAAAAALEGVLARLFGGECGAGAAAQAESEDSHDAPPSPKAAEEPEQLDADAPPAEAEAFQADPSPYTRCPTDAASLSPSPSPLATPPPRGVVGAGGVPAPGLPTPQGVVLTPDGHVGAFPAQPQPLLTEELWVPRGTYPPVRAADVARPGVPPPAAGLVSLTPVLESGDLLKYEQSGVYGLYNRSGEKHFTLSFVFSSSGVAPAAAGDAVQHGDALVIEVGPGETKPFVLGKVEGYKVTIKCGRPSARALQRQHAAQDAAIRASAAAHPPRTLRECVCAKAPFLDRDFPPEATSLARAWEAPTTQRPWHRVADLLTRYPGTGAARGATLAPAVDAGLFITPVEPNTIRLGAFTDLPFCSALAILAEAPELVHALFSHKQYADVGAYKVRLYVGGREKSVLVDTFVPYVGYAPAFASHLTDLRELWIPLAHKAYAKAHGSYVAARRRSVAHALATLTGCPCRTRPVKGEDAFDAVIDGLADGDLVYLQRDAAAGRPPSVVDDSGGFLRNCGYAVVQAKRSHGRRLVRVRNPFRPTKHWHGRWCQTSSHWDENPAITEDLGMSFEHDGCVWMEWDEAAATFHTLGVVQRRRQHHVSVPVGFNGGAPDCIVRLAAATACDSLSVAATNVQAKGSSQSWGMLPPHVELWSQQGAGGGWAARDVSGASLVPIGAGTHYLTVRQPPAGPPASGVTHLTLSAPHRVGDIALFAPARGWLAGAPGACPAALDAAVPKDVQTRTPQHAAVAHVAPTAQL